MIQQQMQLHRTFGATKVRPVEHAGAQIDHGGVHADQLVLEAKLVPPAGLMGGHGTAFGQHLRICCILCSRLSPPLILLLSENSTYQRTQPCFLWEGLSSAELIWTNVSWSYLHLFATSLLHRLRGPLGQSRSTQRSPQEEYGFLRRSFVPYEWIWQAAINSFPVLLRWWSRYLEVFATLQGPGRPGDCPDSVFPFHLDVASFLASETQAARPAA